MEQAQVEYPTMRHEEKPRFVACVPDSLSESYAQNTNIYITPEEAVYCETILFLEGTIPNPPSICTESELEFAYNAGAYFAQKLEETDPQAKLGELQQVFDKFEALIAKQPLINDYSEQHTADVGGGQYSDDSPHKWLNKGRCLGLDPAIFMPEPGEDTTEAKEVCQSCDIQLLCLDYALSTREKGIWGGTSERERRIMLRQRAIARIAAYQPKEVTVNLPQRSAA